jgi:hypothetical protein
MSFYKRNQGHARQATFAALAVIVAWGLEPERGLQEQARLHYLVPLYCWSPVWASYVSMPSFADFDFVEGEMNKVSFA